ncbi:MAG: 16S rRNA (guanine(527)-N(7))-methyltransferase RsmG [cyanobacterium endosymbiont of Rhopalodia musculus]|uniref:16S rRNA (guanine(527)-N(7))-methyltransferase RsmG n=1 Tax=cyanobacterium endosymbiont of Epithemia clementina EcSB TaxID=3034674 RepID=UPI0024812B3A|nr:16S rRNA (guanine(527)-N(7))-methyltransferase RsmG [cyanobacterium endosymbiont of Epithemia clementina EcSB]WGT66662.1 16S rRNA (guanine(527)-N(7))-methyltransferase RsmG [cyanobacterium endosymbiont of Epithemia clementina EcSB]
MSSDSLPELNEIWRKTLHWEPTKSQLELWEKLYQGIISSNRKINLTRITDPNDFWEKHLWDSLAGIDTKIIDIKLSLKGIDIGTGAGFPGIPVATIYPNLQVTLLDSRIKKIKFIDLILDNLKLNNCQTLVGRSETIGQIKEYRATYDLALIRAVGRPSVCTEYALPLLKIGGIAVLYRGHWHDEDQLNLKSALEKLGGEIISIKNIETPLTQSTRNFIYIQKRSTTPRQFPRQIGIPTQNPL